MDRKKGKGFRASPRPGAFQSNPKYLSLSEKVQRDEASPDELAQFKRFQEERVKDILDALPESLYRIEEIPHEIPPKARISGSGICDFCGELTRVDLLRKINGKMACIPCARQSMADEK